MKGVIKPGAGIYVEWNLGQKEAMAQGQGEVWELSSDT